MADASDFFGKEPSWAVAAEIVRNCMGYPHPLWRLTKQSWQIGINETDFVRQLGVTKVPVAPLLVAAGMVSAENKDADAQKLAKDYTNIQAAVANLGSRYASVVLATAVAIYYVKRCADKPIELQISREIMTCIEVGHKMGSKIIGFGSEGGAMMGLTMLLGEATLIGFKPKETRSWWREMPRERKGLIKKTFGCDAYQIAALALQNLGFGYEAPCGVVLSNCRRDAIPDTFPQTSTLWRGAYDWVDALRYGKNYPAAETSRKIFKELTPPEPGSPVRNLVLETLYTELSKVRSDGSNWSWY